jgi:hypothetical protein
LARVPPALAATSLLALTTGCHARFKKAAPGLDEVQLQVVTTGYAKADLAAVPMGTGNDVVDAALLVANIGQEVRGWEQAARIGEAVEVEAVNAQLVAGITETLAAGTPFGIGTAKGGPLLQIELMEYGMDVPYLGAEGRFEYQLKARMYDEDGRRIYKTRLTCDAGMRDPHLPEGALTFANNVRTLERMSDEDINAAFSAVARHCGQQFVVRMRRHAG